MIFKMSKELDARYFNLHFNRISFDFGGFGKNAEMRFGFRSIASLEWL